MKTHVVEVWGDLACFSRPEMKVERFSYPCMTPSAARGVLDAIYVKPGVFRWQVQRIEVLRPPRYIALRRNEVKDTVSVAKVKRWMKGDTVEPLIADGVGTPDRGRTQRQTMTLKDVRYRIHAEIRPWPAHAQQRAAFDAQFERRLGSGKCFSQPYLGCREFAAFFAPPTDTAPVPYDQDIGLMLYDVFDLSRPGSSADAASVSLFRASVAAGVLYVPPYESPAVLKPEATGA